MRLNLWAAIATIAFVAPFSIADEKRQSRSDELNSRMSEVRSKRQLSDDLYADAAVYVKGVTWALRYDESFTDADVAMIDDALHRASQRIEALEAGREPVTERRGKLVRGYVSSVDGSVQPFGLVIPAGYDPTKPMRLDVVLHGSSKPVGMSELRFMNRFHERAGGEQPAADGEYIELHPLGRVENCYRWSGETDVFDAIEAVCRNYNIDRRRIVLRGMSMGASGTWHLGLKHPDRFVALGPYCGYVDTYEFSRTPLPNFVKVERLPPYQEKTLHMLDSIDYAANAGVVPAIACMGDKDVFFQAHELMGRAMQLEGLEMVNLISPGTGHVIDPVTHKEQMRRIAVYADKGIDPAPRQLRFVTWTLKYNRCHWLELLQLDEHYARAEIQAKANDDGSIDITELKNIAAFAIHAPMLQQAKPILRIDGQPVAIPTLAVNAAERSCVIGRRDGQWRYLGQLGDVKLAGKRPGVQGPIDDAFTSKFLCVRGTGEAWNPEVQRWADARLERFAAEWNRYFRGELPIKNDTDVTAEDVRDCNLILFGDPGSNRWIGKVLPELPLVWTEKKFTLQGKTYASADHVPVCIQPSPLAAGRYVVLNSGHSFGEKELASLNYLLFPRLGDWAVFELSGSEPVAVGFFDEAWR